MTQLVSELTWEYGKAMVGIPEKTGQLLDFGVKELVQTGFFSVWGEM